MHCTHRTILFDLDGTLTDPSEEMLGSARYALEQFGLRDVEDQKLRLFLRTPLLECFEQHFGMSRDEADQAFRHYWYYAGTFGLSLNHPYPGVADLVETLGKQGRVLAVATARNTHSAEQILGTLGLVDHFRAIVGTDEEADRVTKKMVIFDLLGELDQMDVSEVLMVGDRPADVQGARENGIETIAVTYGQGDPEELRNAQPAHLVDTVEELSNLLLGTG